MMNTAGGAYMAFYVGVTRAPIYIYWGGKARGKGMLNAEF